MNKYKCVKCKTICNESERVLVFDPELSKYYGCDVESHCCPMCGHDTFNNVIHDSIDEAKQ